MRPDPDYLKKLLTAFQNAPAPTTDIEELESAGLFYEDPEFEFHLFLLRDQGFITDDRDGSLGMDRSADGRIQWSVIPLRLTASGQQFAEALGNNKVLATIKQKFVGVSISTLQQVAVALLKSEIMLHLHT
jgi:DNA-binding transcriptional ArsR family regulator